MLVSAKIKWFGSIILAGTLLILALMGGNWGTDYIASASVDVAPIITGISPASVPAGSPTSVLIIWGSNFVEQDTTIESKLTTGVGFDQLFTPSDIRSGRILVILPASLFVDPTLYTLTVVKTTPGTLPIIEDPIQSRSLYTKPCFYISPSYRTMHSAKSHRRSVL